MCGCVSLTSKHIICTVQSSFSGVPMLTLFYASTSRVRMTGQINDMALYCYPVAPPYPFGYGTACETPTGQVSGEFTKNTTLS